MTGAVAALVLATTGHGAATTLVERRLVVDGDDRPPETTESRYAGGVTGWTSRSG